MICPNCKAIIPKEENFCTECGLQTNPEMANQELLSLSIDDIELILTDQLDLYSELEIAFLKERLIALRAEEKMLLEKQQKELQDERKRNLPSEIVCPKCDGINPSSNKQCQYCSYIFKEKDYYAKSDDKEKPEKLKEDSDRSLFYIAFLLPILGIIIGLIYISKDKEDLGKSLIKFSVIIVVMVSLIAAIFLSGAVDIFQDHNQKICHQCGQEITGDAIEAYDRYYCSYDCYMQEVLFD